MHFLKKIVKIRFKRNLKSFFFFAFFFLNDFFKFFSPKLFIKIKVLQNAAKPKSMSMQMISCKIHLIPSRLDRTMQFENGRLYHSFSVPGKTNFVADIPF